MRSFCVVVFFCILQSLWKVRSRRETTPFVLESLITVHVYSSIDLSGCFVLLFVYFSTVDRIGLDLKIFKDEKIP